MAYETRNNSGSAFKNNRKTQDSHADLTGEIMVDNKLYWLNIKVRKDRNGNDWHSVWVSEKKPREPSAEPVKQNPAPIDDGIPF